MVPPIVGLGPYTQEVESRYDWLTPERLAHVRAVLLGFTLLFRLVSFGLHIL